MGSKRYIETQRPGTENTLPQKISVRTTPVGEVRSARMADDVYFTINPPFAYINRRFRFFIHVFVIFAVSFDSLLGADGLPSGMPPILNFSRYDISAIAGKPVIRDIYGNVPNGVAVATASDRIARNSVNFRYVRAAGVRAAIFQSSYNSTASNGLKKDDSFRVWAPEAAKNSLYVGAYHFFRPMARGGIPSQKEIDVQADFFLQTIYGVCRDNPRALQGRKILLAFDATVVPDTKPEDVVKGIHMFAKAVHDKTGVWPLFYPENGLRDTFVKGLSALHPREAEDLNRCPMWASRYGKAGPVIDDNRLFGLWKRWSLWQYGAGDHWFPDGGQSVKVFDKKTGRWVGKDGLTSWNVSQDPQVFASRHTISDTEKMPGFLYDSTEYPIGPCGSVIPLEGNYFNDFSSTLSAFWNAHAFVAYP